MMEKYFQQPSVMSAQEHFSRVPKAEIQRSTFDRSSAYKTTFNAGNCIPIFCDEVLPGDTYHMDSTFFARLATPLKPVMDNAHLDVHYFFVPSRLVWEHWPNFMGERKTPADDPKNYTIPKASWNPATALTHVGGGDEFAIGDYLGLPKSNVNENFLITALPLRAFALIWDEWYRDENLQNPHDLGDGDANTTSLNYNSFVKQFPRGKRKDYFTSALPWPQKGDPVSIPIGGQIPVVTTTDDTLSGAQQAIRFNKIDGADPGGNYFIGVGSDGRAGRSAAAGGSPADFYYPSNLVANLSAASAVTINALRTAIQLQVMLERDARGGTRYIEMIWEHFGVVNPDFRLQRPEFIGSGTGLINVNPIAATFTSSGNAPQGNLAATATGVVRASFDYSATEHGYIIGVISARTDLTYQRGLERMWTRSVREEFYFPALAHLGEQAILNKEIFLASTLAATNDLAFGYQERFAEYRYKPSRVTGLFSSEESASLDVWHWSQDFANLPALNADFIRENPPIARTIAVQTEPHFLLDSWFGLKCDRPMPVYSVPGLNSGL